ncbi:MAG TPA: SLC13 family permease [Blastocatellia bacterium]|nr:SLC13 family permease [Blastocatellia bacterium]
MIEQSQAGLASVAAPSGVERTDADARQRTPWRGFIGRILCVVVPIALWFAPLDLDLTAKRALAIASFIIIAWITEALDHALTGLIGCYLFWALGVVKFNVAFSGFATYTPWFLFAAVLFGAMATKSGLARRIAFLVILRVGKTYPRILLGLILSDFLLTILVPSGIARVVILGAVALGLVEAFGLSKGSNVGRGMFLILTYTAGIFDKMIIAGMASITARSLIEQFGQVQVRYFDWLIAYLPCDLITIFAAWRLTLWLYPPEKNAMSGGADHLTAELEKMGRWSALEKKSAILMLVAVGLWMTDKIHNVEPELIGIGVGLFAALPRVGVLEIEDLKRVNYLPIFFVAAAMSMGETLRATNALDVLTNVMFAWMQPFVTNVFSSTLTLYWTAFVYHIFLASEVSMLGTSMPLLMNFATSHGLDPLALGMVWTFAAGGKIFVYQSAVLIVGYSYGYFDARDLFRMGLLLTVVESIILILLVPFYWPLIGI